MIGARRAWLEEFRRNEDSFRKKLTYAQNCRLEKYFELASHGFSDEGRLAAE
jgi:hypothetical protein